MKLAVISDIHGNLLALEAVLADIARQGVDQTVNLGDILSGPLQPAETADLLMARDFPTIRGNHERQLLALLAPGASAMDPLSSDGFAAAQVNAAQAGWLRALPAGRALEPDIRLCHGTPGTDLQYWLETVVPGFGDMGSAGIRPATLEEVRERLGDERHGLVLCGHTHVPRVVQCGGALVVNPGSVGLQAYGDARPHSHVVETGAPHARYALLEQAPGGWQVDLRAVPYAHEAQAEVARRHGRPDWAHALLTGRMPRA
ncbi:MAG: metallophosphoesterase family protein [Polaromonas sp.]|uniref:metallophosphoesterase family protein n=1 Tax=Polaromonas sp. TaxID=1869339 RepID=UPI002731EA32|nr:metallophosphoesterase family protein [Polaromonas sp.]MDP2451180.1 metallophosphoesterase family protein [Polaromonas sp.]MDP3245793.1 metallophosphoesterase family protein [Polaromonas sp.]MDP3756708.1 metallophosphoesterase family protein [Polaromonas sp.]MDP3825037.1 metallophosphoesterase family protein [Polaromonas sp.]